MMVNWAIESLKWKMLVSHVQKVSFFTAVKAVLTGLSFSMFVPNGIGEYFGRIVYMREGNRLRSISVTIVGSISQVLVTIVAGCAALIYLRGHAWKQLLQTQGFNSFWLDCVLYMIAMTIGVVAFIYYRLSWLTALVEKMTHGHILPLIALVDGGYNEFIRWVNYVVNDMHSANVAIVGLDKIINDIGVNPAHVEASASEENVDMTVPLRELRHNLAAFVNFLTIVLELSKIVMRSNGTFKQIELGNPFHDKFVCRMLETILDDKKKIREDCSREDRLGVGVDAHQTAVCEMEAMIAFYVRARTTYNDDCEKYAAATSGSDLEKHTQLLPLS